MKENIGGIKTTAAKIDQLGKNVTLNNTGQRTDRKDDNVKQFNSYSEQCHSEKVTSGDTKKKINK